MNKSSRSSNGKQVCPRQASPSVPLRGACVKSQSLFLLAFGSLYSSVHAMTASMCVKGRCQSVPCYSSTKPLFLACRQQQAKLKLFRLNPRCMARIGCTFWEILLGSNFVLQFEYSYGTFLCFLRCTLSIRLYKGSVHANACRQ